jgi:chromate transporter
MSRDVVFVRVRDEQVMRRDRLAFPSRTLWGYDRALVDVKAEHPTFAEAFRFWLKLGFVSFGGPSGQISLMHAELVEKRRWISASRFLHALNYCMLLPGPEATQLAIYIGWLLHKTWGGIVAGALFVLPSAFILWTLSYVYVSYGKLSWVAAVFYGLKPAVLAIVAAAVIRLGASALRNGVMWTLAGLAFLLIYLKVPFPFIVFGAASVGLAGGKYWRQKFLARGVLSGDLATRRANITGTEPVSGSRDIDQGAASSGAEREDLSPADSSKTLSHQQDHVIGDAAGSPAHAKPSLGRAMKVCCLCMLLWWLPVLFLGGWQGWNHVLCREGVFFSKAAMVTFGGAYAVLPYVSQQALEKYQWLNAGQMLDGLALAETTPGPLIMVLQFVGFLGGWNYPGDLPRLLVATLAAFITTWTTFVPCFLWIFLGAPHIEQLRGNVNLTCALSAVTAAVVGVILNLAVWFSLHVLFPDSSAGIWTADWFAVAVGAVAFAGLVKWKWDIIPVVLGAGVMGLVYRLVL